MNKPSKIVHLSAWLKKRGIKDDKIIRLAPELDGLETLYTNDSSPGICFNLKIVAWAMKESGDVVGLVPWLSDIIPCPLFKDPLNGYWAGYRNPYTEEIFYAPPEHKIVELETATTYFADQKISHGEWLQEIPDNLGTHALLTADDFHTIQLIEVVSWRLFKNGRVFGMLPNLDKIMTYPVLLGEKNLYPAQHQPDFKYFFQFSLVERIKKHDPDAMNALSLLCHPPKRK